MSSADAVIVAGAGSWGTALAIQLARNGHPTLLWGRDAVQIALMRKVRSNPQYLPGIEFPENLQPIDNLDEVMGSARYLLAVIPTGGMRAFFRQIKPVLAADTRVIWASKGIETGSGRLLHQVLGEELGLQQPHAVVSGPTFAKEVASNYPTAMTLAANNELLRNELAEVFHGGNMRLYTSTDIMGVELGGAVKNVLAIAAGISDGLGFGANARSALITRGLAEIMRLGDKMGACRETLMGLAGLGDLVLTCTDNQSRNRRFGLAIGAGKSQAQALEEIGQVVEGAKTAGVIVQVAENAGVDMPICHEVYKILYQGLPPKDAVKDLLGRRLKAEF
ncbi:MAG TPA: NAD(P)-dependent glycerol-3-phosphate dehydrogenase [Gammaproteobacteria bacterium]|nr:NAD(P)-dependent glycerol-3-phosphate dehydrogenase [Gammaproteobacteria bacterium]